MGNVLIGRRGRRQLSRGERASFRTGFTTGADATLTGDDVIAYFTPDVESSASTVVVPASLHDSLHRLEELASLPRGWDFYGAAPISDTVVDVVLELLRDLLEGGMESPEIDPTVEGGLDLRWVQEGLEFEIEADPERGLSFFFEDTETGRSFEGGFSDVEDELSEIIVRFLRD